MNRNEKIEMLEILGLSVKEIENSNKPEMKEVNKFLMAATEENMKFF